MTRQFVWGWPIFYAGGIFKSDQSGQIKWMLKSEFNQWAKSFDLNKEKIEVIRAR